MYLTDHFVLVRPINPIFFFSYLFLQINLSYTKVTDVGLLTLATISCLQSLTILHKIGLTHGGIATALLSFGGLTKAKLHFYFKSLLPEPLLKHLETRGCVFQWRDKTLEVRNAIIIVTQVYTPAFSSITDRIKRFYYD